MKSLASFIYSCLFTIASFGSLISCVKSDLVFINTFSKTISASSYCLLREDKDHSQGSDRTAAIEKAKERTLFFLIPQLQPNSLKFNFNRITKKIFYSFENLNREEIEFFVEEPHIDQLIKVTARAVRKEKDLFLFQLLPGKNIVVEEEIFKVDDDPNSIQKKIFETAYIQLIDFFSERTFGENTPLEIQGYITILQVNEHTEDDRFGKLDVIANVFFLV